jgi:serine protease inhibitor
VQLPKSGSNSIFYAHQKLLGYSVFYDLNPNFKLDHAKPTIAKELTLHLRDPLDRFWAGFRQDFLDSRMDSLEEYCKKNIDTILNLNTDLSYKINSTLHIKEDILFRIRRILELTNGWWDSVYLESSDKINTWLDKKWNYRETVRLNQHDIFLKQKLNELRKDNPTWDNRVLNLPYIKKEQKLYSYLGNSFNIEEFKKIILLISLKD